MIDWIKNNLDIIAGIVGILGFAAGVIGVILTVKNTRKKILEYHVTSTKLITEDIANIPNFKISIGGESASDLTATTVDFVNTGNATIHSSDIANMGPIQLISSGHFFNASEIDEEYIRSDNECLNQSVSVVDDNKIVIGFEYLDPKQTFSITVWHDGEVSVFGKVKSGKFQCSSSIEHSNKTRSFAFKPSHFFSGVVITLLISFSAALFIRDIQLSRELSTLNERYMMLLYDDSTDFSKQMEAYNRALEYFLEILSSRSEDD